jgi:hypothetical protein
MILRFLFYAFLIYLAFRLLFNFILPVYRTTKQVKKGFREMHERMNQATGPQQPQKAEEKPKAGEYIDFEEVKE